ncbi:MAG: ABC transporter substrate-binding protein [bacterium]|nr:ABC transporter substrate-binding protein [bacterium]
MSSGRRLSLIVAALVVGCSGVGAPPGVVRLGWSGSPDTLHPGRTLLAYSYTILGLIYDSLYGLGPDGQVQPQALRSAAVSADGCTWTLSLRTDLRFHDGVRLTAHDAAFSIDLYRDRADYPLLHGYTRNFDSVDAIDDSTLVLRLTQPLPNLPNQLVYLYILPQHLWRDRVAAADDEGPPPVVGSGPFRVEAFHPKRYLQLSAWRSHPQAPAIDGALFVSYASRDALVLALRSAQLDAILETPFTAVADLRHRAGIHVVAGTPLQPEITNLIINQVDPADCPEEGVCSGHPALRDARVRRALALAVHEQKLIDIVLLGQGTPGWTLIPPALGDWFHTGLQAHTYDPVAARELLDEAGDVDTDGDGVREMPDGGQPLRLRLQWPSDSLYGDRGAQLLGAMFAAVGVAIQPRTVDPDALIALGGPAFDFDLVLWGWTTGPDPSFLLEVMTGDNIDSGGNESGFHDAEFDSLFARQAAALDLTARRDLVWRMQQLVHDTNVYVVPFYPDVVQAYRTERFTGWLEDAPRVALESRQALARLRSVLP